MNLAQILEDSANKFGERTALASENRRYSYQELNRQVNALGNHLLGLGLEKGDKIAIMLPNCPEFVISYFAAVRIGAVAVTLNAMSTPYELKHILSDSDSRVFITQAAMVKRFQDIQDDLPLCRHCLLADAADHPASLQTIIAQGPFNLAATAVEEGDPAVMIYTSGLTGRPLGAMLTHGNLLAQSWLVRDTIGGTQEDCSLSVIPLFHSFGAVGNMLAAIRIGAGMVLMDRFTLEGIFAAIERERITYLAAVPRLFLGMVFFDGAAKYDISSVRVCITGGAAMPPEFIPQFQDRFHIPLLEGYGLTEASPVCYFTRLGMVQKPGSIGVCVPGVEGKIVDEEGRELPRGTVGELIVRGPNVMKGYYRDEEATAQVIKDGWLYTSDLGRMDEEGYVFLTGRKKRMIITSGFNVYPREVEAVLELHDNVVAALVAGKEDLMRGEIVKAFVVKSPGAEADEKEILRHCRTYLSSYKLPREVEFVTELPR
ncbi:MAG: long-chain fatty acid--CoA ligase [Smithellaceae bacterium]|nr:long-chain fatty acid--CoA ligase [Smithellaceae bacterium]